MKRFFVDFLLCLAFMAGMGLFLWGFGAAMMWTETHFGFLGVVVFVGVIAAALTAATVGPGCGLPPR